VYFERELTPLILNIHGETKHVGKRPKRNQEGTDKHTDLIRLKREMQDAVVHEDYERASKIRDEIRKLGG
jgi:protein arginine kinase activator